MKSLTISGFGACLARHAFLLSWSRIGAAALAAAGTVRAADVTSTWAAPASGTWNTAANWTNAPLAGGFPNNGNAGVASYDALINAGGGAYTVTLGTDVTVEDLILNSSNATVSHTSGTLTATGGLSLAAGTYELRSGTISNTAINLSGGSLVFTSSAGIFSNGTVLNGDLNLSAANAGVRLLSGANFTGTANLTGSGAALAIQETRTLAGKTINLEGANARLAVDGTSTLTLGTGTLVRGRGTVGQAAYLGGTSTLVNQGTIRADITGQTLTISPSTFTNAPAGRIAVVNGARLSLGGTWSNTGQISLADASTLDYGGTWNNAGGTVTVDATSTLNLDGTMTASGLGTISNSAGGTVNIGGKLDNTGNTLAFSPATGSWQLRAGEIIGGQITPDPAGPTLVFTSSAGILSNGAVFNGDLNLSTANAGLRLLSGADFTGTANLTGSGAALAIQETRTLAGKTINLEGANARLAIDGTSTLTLGTGTLVRGRGTVGQATYLGGTSTLVNQGTIRADLTGQTLTVSPNTFTNTPAGRIAVTNGARLSLNGTWSNTGQINVSDASTLDYGGTWNNAGGTVTVDATSTLNLDGTMTASGLGTVSNSAGGTVNLNGKLDNTGNTLAFSPATGSWQLRAGEIIGGQITPDPAGPTLVFTSSAGILSNGAVFNGDLNLSTANAGLRLLSGADFTGTANLTGSGAALAIQETRTLAGKTINLEGPNARLAVDGTSTLTLGAGTLVRGRGTVGQASYVGGTSTLVNQGTIRADITGQTLTISPNTFTNAPAGRIAVVNGARLSLNGTWSNTGQINVSDASTLDYGGTWNNAGGTVTVDATSTLNLDGTMTAAGLGTIGNAAGGTVNLNGKLDNTGNTLAFSPATGSWQFRGGEIIGGQITPDPAGPTLVFTSSAGILSNGAVFNGDLNLSTANAGVRLLSGADFTGTANLTGSGAALAIQETRTLAGKTINLEGANARLAVDGTSTLTLGTGTLVRGRGTVGQATYVGGTSTLVNQGTIRADITGQTLTISPNTFSNAGVVSAENGGTLAVNAGYRQSAGSTRVVGGTLNIGNPGARQTIHIDGGSLEGRGTINSNVTVAGTIAPDLSAATGLVLNGDLTLTSTAVMRFDIGGTTQGVGYDFLNHTGTTPVTLAGALAVQFTNTYQDCAFPADNYVVFTSSQDLQGSFANVPPEGRLATSDGLGSFKVHYGPASRFGPKSIVLTDYASVAGPTGLGQFAAWATTMGLPPDQAGATDDPDHDGVPNAIEYALGLHPMQVQPQTRLSTPTVRTSATQPTSLEISFRMADPQPPDVGLQIEASPDLAGPWQRIAWKSSASSWCGATAVVEAPSAGQRSVTITDVQPVTNAPTRFLRLRATIVQP